MENGGVAEVAPRGLEVATLESKPYNPFEDEEEEPPAATGSALAHPESTAKSLHPWYGITPTSSPKTKKRPAPRAPSASPLGECRSRQPGPWAWAPGSAQGRGGYVVPQDPLRPGAQGFMCVLG